MLILDASLSLSMSICTLECIGCGEQCPRRALRADRRHVFATAEGKAALASDNNRICLGPPIYGPPH